MVSSILRLYANNNPTCSGSKTKAVWNPVYIWFGLKKIHGIIWYHGQQKTSIILFLTEEILAFLTHRYIIDGSLLHSPPPVIPLSLIFNLSFTECPQAWLTRSWWRVCCRQLCSSGRCNDRRNNRYSPVNKPFTHGHACRDATWRPHAAGVTHRTSSYLPHVVNV